MGIGCEPNTRTTLGVSGPTLNLPMNGEWHCLLELMWLDTFSWVNASKQTKETHFSTNPNIALMHITISTNTPSLHRYKAILCCYKSFGWMHHLPLLSKCFGHVQHNDNIFAPCGKDLMPALHLCLVQNRAQCGDGSIMSVWELEVNILWCHLLLTIKV